VTLKVSKARAVLPNRKDILASQISKKSCEVRLSNSKKKVISGPLLPNGEFRSDGTRIRSEDLVGNSLSSYRKNTNLGGNWKPAFLDLRILSLEERRKLCKNPGRIFKSCLPQGQTPVYPDRDSVRDYHRRSHALNYVRKAFCLMTLLDDTSFIETCDSLLGILPEIFRCRPNCSKVYDQLNKQLRFSKRSKLRDRSQDQRSRREALIEHRVNDLYIFG
jgi:hypothetical protein